MAHGKRPVTSPPLRSASAASPRATMASIEEAVLPGGIEAAVAAAREIPGTQAHAVATAEELRQVPRERRYRFLQLRMATRYRKQAWEVLGPLMHDSHGGLHVRGLQTVRDEGKVARIVRGRREAHFLTCVP